MGRDTNLTSSVSCPQRHAVHVQRPNVRSNSLYHAPASRLAVASPPTLTKPWPKAASYRWMPASLYCSPSRRWRKLNGRAPVQHACTHKCTCGVRELDVWHGFRLGCAICLARCHDACDVLCGQHACVLARNTLYSGRPAHMPTFLQRQQIWFWLRLTWVGTVAEMAKELRLGRLPWLPAIDRFNECLCHTSRLGQKKSTCSMRGNPIAVVHCGNAPPPTPHTPHLHIRVHTLAKVQLQVSVHTAGQLLGSRIEQAEVLTWAPACEGGWVWCGMVWGAEGTRQERGTCQLGRTKANHACCRPSAVR